MRHVARAIHSTREMEGFKSRPSRRSREADRSGANRPRKHEAIAQLGDISAADLPVERQNATPAGEVLRQTEGGNNAEAPYGASANVRLECMGGIFEQRNLQPVALRAERDGTIGKTVGVARQDGGNARRPALWPRPGR